MEKVIYVEWIDSTSLSGGGWKSKDDLDTIDKMPIIKSIGFLVEEHEEYITMVAHMGMHQINGDMTIPKVAIKKRRWLK